MNKRIVIKKIKQGCLDRYLYEQECKREVIVVKSLLICADYDYDDTAAIISKNNDSKYLFQKHWNNDEVKDYFKIIKENVEFYKDGILEDLQINNLYKYILKRIKKELKKKW